MAVKDQLIIKDAVTKWINQWIKRELRGARRAWGRTKGEGEGGGDGELDGDGQPGMVRSWRLSFVTQITEHLAGTFQPYPLDGQTPWGMTNSYGTADRTYNLGISPETRSYSCQFLGPHNSRASLERKRAKTTRINPVPRLKIIKSRQLRYVVNLLSLTFARWLSCNFN